MILIFITCLITATYFIIKRHFSKWQSQGIPTDEPFIPFGSLFKVFRQEEPFGLCLANVYNKFQSKIVGFYMFFKPTILIRDASLARQIMTSDFASFHDRGLYVDEKHDPMSAHLFALPGQQWRQLRTKLTPSFSSGNLKRMFDTVDDVADKLIQHLNGIMADGKTHTLEVKTVLTTFAVDIIGSVIFGLDIDSFSNPGNEFRELSDRLFKTGSPLQKFRNLANFVYPPLASLLSRLGVNDPVTYYLRDIVKRTIEFREKHNVVRKDLLQSMINLRKSDQISEENEIDKKNNSSVAELSIDMIAANSFLFYIAGSETTAATTAFTLYELAMNSEILAKVQKEVDECLQKHNLKAQGRYTYEFIQDLKYLDMCVMETTRKYPGLPFLNRECTQDFQVPDTKFTIHKGTGVVISLWGIHRDEKYFPQPQDYIPERFSEDNQNYDPVAFMPFGEGPRHCIAQRMGIINVKVALSKILANFIIAPMPRNEIEFSFHTAPVLVPKHGLNVGLSKRW